MKSYLKKASILLFALLFLMLAAIPVGAFNVNSGDVVLETELNIYTQDEFDDFVRRSATYNFEGVYVYMRGNFTLGSYIGPARGDTAHYFAGRLVGGGHTITMTGCERSDVFGAFSGTKGAVISDLKVTGKLRKGFWADNVGGIVCEAIDTTFYDCSFTGFAEGAKLHAGGIAGIATSSSFMRCHVNAQVTATEEAGGIVGRAVDCTISDCTYGDYDKIPISGNKYIGGIVGYAVNVDIYDCVNSVRVGYNTDTAHFCGGIVGCYDGDLWITDCINEGNVTGGRSVGGIVGAPANAKTNNHRSISGVINRGKVTMTPVKDHGGAGGIAGILTNATLSDAQNEGDVVSASSSCGGNFGGIVGVSEGSYIYRVMNYGNVTGPGSSVNVVSKTGGIVGWLRGNVREDVEIIKAVYKSGNQGNITGFGENVGAFIGFSDKGGAYLCVSSGKLNETKNESRYATDCVIAKNENYNAAVISINQLAGSYAQNLWGLDANGKPTILFKGLGSSHDPYRISSLNELKMLAENVNQGYSSYSGDYFLLEADIFDDGTLEPIGDTLGLEPYSNRVPAFMGDFDGGGHTVYLKMKPDGGSCAALFGFLYGAEIKNLRTAGYVVGELSNSYNVSSDFLTVPATAGICAKAVNSLFRNCQNDANIQGTISGGIVGIEEVNRDILFNILHSTTAINATFDSVVNCLNRGEINGIVAAGGIVGRTSFERTYVVGTFEVTCDFEILHCVNDGVAKVMYYHEKTDTDPLIGAIVGYMAGDVVPVRQCFYRADDESTVLCGKSSVKGKACASYTNDSIGSIANFAGYDKSIYTSKRDDVDSLADDRFLISDDFHPYIAAFHSHDHAHPDTVYYQMDAGIGFDGHKTYYGCLTCGKRFYDEAMKTAVKSDAELKLKTLIRAKSGSIPITKLDSDSFFSAEEVYQYVRNHPTRTYSYIELGFDIETDVPILYAQDIRVVLNGYRWLYSGTEDSSVFAEDTAVSQPRTFTLEGDPNGWGERGLVEVYEFSFCRLLKNLRYTTEITIRDTDISHTGASTNGGMISTDYSGATVLPSITLENVTVTNSIAGQNGGTICLESYQPDLSVAIRMKNTVFDSCSATCGGAIYIYSAFSHIEGDGNSQFRHCQALELGGAVCVRQSGYSSFFSKNQNELNGINGFTFIGNYAGLFPNYGAAKLRGIQENACGGAIATNMPEYTITDCVFQVNLASGHGGALYQFTTGMQRRSDITVSDCSFMDDMALGLGYEIYISYGNLKNLTIQNSKASKMENVAYAKKEYTNDTDIRPIKIFVASNQKAVTFSSLSYEEGAALGSAVAEGNTVFVIVSVSVCIVAIGILIFWNKYRKKKHIADE